MTIRAIVGFFFPVGGPVSPGLGSFLLLSFPMKIFVIDDSSFSRKAIMSVLKEIVPDALLLPFGDGEEALARFPRSSPTP